MESDAQVLGEVTVTATVKKDTEKMKKIVQRDLTSIGCRACVRTQ